MILSTKNDPLGWIRRPWISANLTGIGGFHAGNIAREDRTVRGDSQGATAVQGSPRKPEAARPLNIAFCHRLVRAHDWEVSQPPRSELAQLARQAAGPAGESP